MCNQWFIIHIALFCFSVHGFRDDSTNLSVEEGATHQIITIALDLKGTSLTETLSVTTFGFQITCLGSSIGSSFRAASESLMHVEEAALFRFCMIHCIQYVIFKFASCSITV